MSKSARRPSQWSEGRAVALLAKLFASPERSLLLGIGDDAALLARPRQPLVLTIDACVEHVHFERRWLSLEDVGFRATQAAVSDLAAMGARPLAALANLALPPRSAEAELTAVARGQARAARALGCPIVGGNLTRASELSLTTAVIGTAPKSLLRSGARPGDELWLIGELGLAAAGLASLRAGKRSTKRALAACVAAWRRPRALIAEGLKLASVAHSCCDVSDGLARDAGHLSAASGVKLVIEEPALRAALTPALLEAAAALGLDALELSLFGGEDYALLATGPGRRRPKFARRLGRVERGRGVRLERSRGPALALEGGFDHLAPERSGLARQARRTRK